MEILEAAIHTLVRFVSYLGTIHFIQWSEKWIHRYFLPKTWQREIGNNSDLMHAIAIVFWIIIISAVIFSIIHISIFIKIDICLDSGGKWIHESNVCEVSNI